MISDSLWECTKECRRYLGAEEFAGCYDSLRPELETLLDQMDGMRARLDAPPVEVVKQIHVSLP